MTVLNALDLKVFLYLNGSPSTAPWLLVLAYFLANQLIYLVPVGLVGTWCWGNATQRKLALHVLCAVLAVLAINYLAGLAWPRGRPFVLDVGHTFFAHAPTPAFPSNHAGILWAIGFTLVLNKPRVSAGWLVLAAGLGVAWSRIFLGVHFPLDMAGALVSAALASLAVSLGWKHIEQPLVSAAMRVYRLIFAYPIAWKWVRD
ncbi:phosphatase PAP2 family protein [Allopusillimonas ginsengisoli]|uniref:phosphatase PAP2 family protein n=1 Tax=Allopusillimonas ginsengisoli TaxID=453575 RepID=UPI0014304AA2|nr:phosphatase PAP2 family protein [Allopusillimonas ginsengisoli]